MARGPIETMFSVYGKSPYGTGLISMVVEGGLVLKVVLNKGS